MGDLVEWFEEAIQCVTLIDYCMNNVTQHVTYTIESKKGELWMRM